LDADTSQVPQPAEDGATNEFDTSSLDNDRVSEESLVRRGRKGRRGVEADLSHNPWLISFVFNRIKMAGKQKMTQDTR